jgi:hypothetical protein
MSRSRFTIPIALIVGLIALLTIVAVPLTAQAADQAHTAKGIGPVYDAAHEITIDGIIQSVITKTTPGSPAGMHLLVMGPEGLVDAHVGPFLNTQTKAELKEGVSVQIVGAMVSIRGKDFLFARQMTVAGHTITLRNEHGILSPVPGSGHTHGRAESQSQREPNGGAR